MKIKTIEQKCGENFSLMLYGDAGTGKTTLAVNIAIAIHKKLEKTNALYDKTVCIIDTENASQWFGNTFLENGINPIIAFDINNINAMVKVMQNEIAKKAHTIIVDSLTNIGSLYEKELVDKHKRQSWTPAKEEFKKNFITFAHKNNINMIYCAREHQNDNGEIKPVGAMGISYDTSCVCNLSVCVKENVSERRWFCSKDRYTTLHDKTGKGYLTVSDFSHHIDKIVPFIPSEYCLEIANEIDAVDYFLGLQPIADRIKLDNTLSNQEKEFLRQKYSLKKKQYQHDIGGNVCSEKEV